MRFVSCLAIMSLLTAAPLTAQKIQAEPRRPNLGAAADTTDAQAYYQFGVSHLTRNPRQAADAFYWASRLDPAWADPLYARRLALLMSEPERFMRYMEGARNVRRSEEVQRIDSLYRRALTLNPFLNPKLDVQAITHTLAEAAVRDIRLRYPGEQVDRNELNYWIESYMRSAGPATLAWIAHSEGRYPAALKHYATALKRGRDKAGVRADRARVFFVMGSYDSARVEMGRAVEEMRKQDEKALVRLYESKALFEHSIGLILEQQGHLVGAREAYARALQEDLSYYPAHLRLGALALAAGDTATALSEMELATQIKGDDAAVRLAYGRTLFAAGRHEAAVEQLREAIRLEPHFAPPYLLSGQALEAQGAPAEALEQYIAFIERASRGSAQLVWAKQRAAALSAAQNGNKP